MAPQRRRKPSLGSLLLPRSGVWGLRDLCGKHPDRPLHNGVCGHRYATTTYRPGPPYGAGDRSFLLASMNAMAKPQLGVYWNCYLRRAATPGGLTGPERGSRVWYGRRDVVWPAPATFTGFSKPTSFRLPRRPDSSSKFCPRPVIADRTGRWKATCHASRNASRAGDVKLRRSLRIRFNCCGSRYRSLLTPPTADAAPAVSAKPAF